MAGLPRHHLSVASRHSLQNKRRLIQLCKIPLGAANPAGPFLPLASSPSSKELCNKSLADNFGHDTQGGTELNSKRGGFAACWSVGWGHPTGDEPSSRSNPVKVTTVFSLFSQGRLGGLLSPVWGFIPRGRGKESQHPDLPDAKATCSVTLASALLLFS